MLVTVEVAHHLTHLEMLSVVLWVFFLLRGVVSLNLVGRFAQETLLHALRVLYLWVDERPQLVLQLFNVDLLLNLHQV